MRTVLVRLCVLLTMVPAAWAQAEPPPRSGAEPASPIRSVGLSVAGREALSRCRDLALRAKGLHGHERLRVIAEAASNYDRVFTGFAQESRVAAKAAFAAAELWRRHGSLALAEKDYLHAATADAGRFGQRGLLGAADMQRRQRRLGEALVLYRRAVAVEPGSSHAQAARMAIAKLLVSMKRSDEAISAARIALECARPGLQVIAAANLIALLLIDSRDFDAAQNALDYAAKSIEGLDNGDLVLAERLQKAVAAMSARRALRRLRDKANGSAADAVRFEVDRRR